MLHNPQSQHKKAIEATFPKYIIHNINNFAATPICPAEAHENYSSTLEMNASLSVTEYHTSHGAGSSAR